MDKSEPDIFETRAVDASDDRALTEELLSAAEYSFSVLDDSETGERSISFYFDTEEEAAKTAEILASPPDEWRALGVSFEYVRVERLRREDWAESWKKHFGIQHPAPGIVIKPSWLEHSPSDDETVIELDPGMCFGTGRHPTTVFCLEALVETAAWLKNSKAPKSALEAGCGSGILSIAAWKLGFEPVAAFDKDDEAVVNARDNIQRNGIPDGAILLETADSASFHAGGRQYGVVNANMLAPGLVSGKNALAAAVAEDGYIVLAGTMEKEYDGVAAMFLELGFDEVKTKLDAEWKSGILRKR